MGAVFRDLAMIISDQGETVNLLEHHVDETQRNVARSQAELFKYLNSISSDRMLLGKVRILSAHPNS